MTSTAPISGASPDTAAAQPAQAPASDSASTQSAQAPPSAGSATNPTSPAQSASNSGLRLVIEDDKAAGCFVYMTVNPITGEVVSQVPREQLLKMRTNPDYTPGSIINSVS
jgi:flagellar protein FlaG